MAMVEIIRVPASRGTTPKLPEEPIWSVRSEVCGLQCKPKRNSWTGTREKNCIDSNKTDNTMPSVQSTASVEQLNKKNITTRSTACLAFKALPNFISPQTAPTRASTKTLRLLICCDQCCIFCNRSATASIFGPYSFSPVSSTTPRSIEQQFILRILQNTGAVVQIPQHNPFQHSIAKHRKYQQHRSSR